MTCQHVLHVAVFYNRKKMISENAIILFNPRAAQSKPRLPNSILSLASVIEGLYNYSFVDSNLESNPWEKINQYIQEGKIKYFCCTVMPGPQLKQAIPLSKRIRELFPDIIIIWGGYFPAQHPKEVLLSGYVDYIISGPAEYAFPQLLATLENNTSLLDIKGLVYHTQGKIQENDTDEIPDLNLLPPFPYEKLHHFYPLQQYLAKTFLGEKTIGYHSSYGCPYNCSFCGVASVYQLRWKGKSPEKIVEDLLYLKTKFGGDAVEFNDNNFFTSEKRSLSFAKLMLPHKFSWWAEGRIDTLYHYADETLKLMSDSGCKMIFLGAESGNDAVLEKMSKGGTQNGDMILSLTKRLLQNNIIPELSFVFGLPSDTKEEVLKQINEEITFIKKLKKLFPQTVVILYVYSPVVTAGTKLYEEAMANGFIFPRQLEDWISPQWEGIDQRKNPLTPWLSTAMVRKIKNFETLLNGYYPNASDIGLSTWTRRLLKAFSYFRYKTGIYAMPYEIKLLQKIVRYRYFDKEGF